MKNRISKTFMMVMAVAAVFIGMAGVAQATLVMDNFNRAATGAVSNQIPNPIGTNYTISSGIWSIGAAQSLVGGLNPSRMYENTLQTLNTGANSFTLSADVMVLTGSGRNGGIMCNFQDDGNYYLLRYSVDGAVAQFGFLESVDGVESYIGAGVQKVTNVLFASTFYTLNISSSNSTFNYSISTVGGPVILSGTVADSTFTGGYSGFYRRGGGNVTIDNYSLEVIPEPATIGMLGVATLGLLAWRRLKG